MELPRNMTLYSTFSVAPRSLSLPVLPGRGMDYCERYPLLAAMFHPER